MSRFSVSKVRVFVIIWGSIKIYLLCIVKTGELPKDCWPIKDKEEMVVLTWAAQCQAGIDHSI